MSHSRADIPLSSPIKQSPVKSPAKSPASAGDPFKTPPAKGKRKAAGPAKIPHSQSIQFRSPMRLPYQNLVERIKASNIFKEIKEAWKTKNYEIFHSQFSQLGNAHVASQEYYFAESDEVKRCAIDFMCAFWSDPSRVELVEKVQLDKFNATKSSTPACLSFVHAKLYDQDVCLLAFSGDTKLNSELADAVEKFCFSLNEYRDVRFFFIRDYNQNYDVMLRDCLFDIDPSIPKTHNPFKICAEKPIGATLIKMLLEFPDIEINGLVNLGFYPFVISEQDKYKAVGSPAKIYEKDAFMDTGEHRLFLRACCRDCQENYPAVFAILLAIKQDNDPQFLSPIKDARLQYLLSDQRKIARVEKSISRISTSESSGSDSSFNESIIASSSRGLFSPSSNASSMLRSDEEKEVLSLRR